jgi:penicillin-binding protein 2
MLIFDQLKRNDPPLRLLALTVGGGLALLLAGLWWVQVVRGRYYETKKENQSYRTVRVPAPRGLIRDRNGYPLAENQPNYNLSLYLEELSGEFQRAYGDTLVACRKQAGRKLTRAERSQIAHGTRYAVASNTVARIGRQMHQPLLLDQAQFQRHYERNLALPLPVMTRLDAAQVARLEEQPDLPPGLDLDVQPVRTYPYGPTAAHLLGYVRRDDSSVAGEDSFFNYRLPDYRGIVGVESALDTELRGKAGVKSVLVNNLGYRQSENIWAPVEPGQNVVLTIDLPIQQAAERALQRLGPAARGAVVVLDTQSGDILALGSAPAFDPNDFVRGLTREQWERLSDERLRPQINRALQENYAPGSIFKVIVALAALENGLNPDQTYHVQPDPTPSSPRRAGRGCIFVGKRKIEDTAAAGDYNFRRAFIHSSNAYFIGNGLRAGIRNIVRLGQKFHLGERTGLHTRQEVAGHFPDLKRVSAGWTDGNTANVCIGQDPVLVTPLQMAVMTAAIANGGKVLRPRLVARLEPQDFVSGQTTAPVESAVQVRDELGVSARSLNLLRQAMLADVEDAEGTGRAAAVPGFRVGGKTGTAEVMNEKNEVIDNTTWFISFAPYENPRYAVVVMVESGGSGGGTCAPLAHDIYLAIQKREPPLSRPKTETLARAD